MEDTIAAISTTTGRGAISIIRISGKEAIKMVNKIFRGENLENVPSHTIHYGHIIYEDIIHDEVLITVMKSPKTFTTEDVVEINCHGNILVTKKILEILLTIGCRLAEPGEFTKRAFLNGRIDLIEAEGIMELINSRSEKEKILALNQINGKVSNMIKDLRQQILEILANIEVKIDYPEYEDIEDITYEDLINNIKPIENKIKKIIKESNEGKIIKEGIKTAIVGRPNVGKSSILNRLLEEEKAIVTEIEGTTRDTVEGTITVNGIILDLIDTAGIRKTNDIVENIGVNKSLKIIDKSDLVLLVLNNNEELQEYDKIILEKIKNKNYIIIINKTDLPKKLNITNENKVEISALNNTGIEKLKQKIIEMYDLEQIESKDTTYLTNARSLSLLNKSLILLEEVKQGINKHQPIDMIEIDLKEIWELLGEITGETYQEELINQLFSQFCLGK
ncbi:MAG: tRNA uridine-5-carboxymethylaminomethyl(34) synthesis GTPase MnmE [Bacilli bacterium]|nr:tRNA uridine-5-carboxymethylaminomethyl(34) synthesis GTPase MnmE [Bacilli bacterium]